MDHCDSSNPILPSTMTIWGPDCPTMLSEQEILDENVPGRFLKPIGSLYGELRVLGIRKPFSRNSRVLVVQCHCGVYGTEYPKRLASGRSVCCPTCLRTGRVARKIPHTRWTCDAPKLLPFDTDNEKIGKTFAFITVLGKTRGRTGLDWSVRCACGTYGSVESLRPYEKGRQICCPHCRVYLLERYTNEPPEVPQPSWWPPHPNVLERLDAIHDIVCSSQFLCEDAN